MKRAIVTGMNGTLAPQLAKLLRTNDYQVVAWDRFTVPPDNTNAVREFLDVQKPDLICHLAMGDADWAGLLAEEAHKRDCKLLFTSTAMVFDSEPNGPHHVTDDRTAKDDYGQGKIRCEDNILCNNPNATLVRIGWQIDWEAGGNNMFSHLKKTHDENGVIDASECWYPACSLMKDTSATMLGLVVDDQTGVFHLDSNRQDKLCFAEIVSRISQRFHLGWQVNVTQDYVHDQRLLDPRVKIPNISNHL